MLATERHVVGDLAGSSPRAGSRRRTGRRAARDRVVEAAVRAAWVTATPVGSPWPAEGAAGATTGDAARTADAGRAVLELAEADDDAALRLLLRPDPASTATTWTVACYRIGDLVPCTLQDFPAPVDAVLTFAHCDDPSHVAAELLACSADGLRWVALVRTGAEVRLQPLGAATVLAEGSALGGGASRASSSAPPAGLAAAQRRWAAQLAAWATVQGGVGTFRGWRWLPTAVTGTGPVWEVVLPDHAPVRVSAAPALAAVAPPRAEPGTAGAPSGAAAVAAVPTGSVAPMGGPAPWPLTAAAGVAEPGVVHGAAMAGGGVTGVGADAIPGPEELVAVLQHLAEAVGAMGADLHRLERAVRAVSNRMDAMERGRALASPGTLPAAEHGAAALGRPPRRRRRGWRWRLGPGRRAPRWDTPAIETGADRW